MNDQPPIDGLTRDEAWVLEHERRRAETEPTHVRETIEADLAARADPEAAAILRARNPEAYAPGAELEGQPVLVSVADVVAERVRWLWEGRLPLAKLSVLDGDPGLGKSCITIDLGARVTTGSPLPDGTPCEHPGAVLAISAEDGVADTIRPRAEAAGADLKRVWVMEGVTFITERGAETRLLTLPGDVDAIEAAIEATKAVLVVIDPLAAFLGERIDAHKDHDVRRALMPLARMAERCGAAIVVVRHLSKAGGSNPLYRGGGSIGIIGAARAGLLVGVDPDDEGRRVLTVPKHNLAPETPALAYRLVPDELHDCVRVQWEGVTAHKPEDLLAAKEDLRQEERSARDEAVEFLVEVLKGDPQRGRDVKRAAAEAGITDRTLARARQRAGVEVRRKGSGRDVVTWWSLIEDSTRATGATHARPGATGTSGTSGQKSRSPKTSEDEGGTSEPLIRRLEDEP